MAKLWMHHDDGIYHQRSMTQCHCQESIFPCRICNIKTDYEKGESKFRGQILLVQYCQEKGEIVLCVV